MISLGEFVTEAERYWHSQRHQRRGQAYYNYLYDHVNSRMATAITGTLADPFYDDALIPIFLRALADMGMR